MDARDVAAAVRRVAPAGEGGELGIYRGWMLRPEAYARLYEALAGRGVELINSPAAYHHCHYLPEWYGTLAGHTPQSVWLPLAVRDLPPMDAVMDLLRPFGARALALKDFVSSRKHEWAEAYYIPSAADRLAIERVVMRFLELQGEDLNEGLVFREYMALDPLATHSKSGMPLAREFRLFFLDGEPLCTLPYWEEGEYGNVAPPSEPFQTLAGGVRSRFFTMDVARHENGEWVIVELGDAQVAGLPAHADVAALYRALGERAPTHGNR